ncbi:MAG: Na/Pi cotransporter family protein [Lachnospiraceae bacterium]|nr:Na/Pi cotransporter family protein [Lachnospiraceae bacterium]
MDLFSVLTMIGGLALFLYGMNTMSDGLSKLSGGHLERILEKLTSGPIRAVLLGAGVTAVIQSSSATTVMVVGFVNSGIMKLSQAIGIIMGANIGTTMTSWILSLSGIEGSSMVLRLLKPSSFSPILAAIGIIMIMFSKEEKKKDVGNILAGFAVLMFGMDTMSKAVAPLADVPEFTSILTMFSNPVMGILAGALLTAVIQSSSASVGILQALSKTGAISFSAAVPIILGQNIGTCVTALLSAAGANRNARRASIVHLYFNIIGTILFMAVFYTANAVIGFTFMDDSVNAANIAVVHSIFNISATLVLLPFTKLLEKLAYMTIKDEPGETKEVYALLDERFLSQPAFAISQCKNVASEMSELALRAFVLSVELLTEYNEEKAKEVVRLEDEVDRYEDEIGSYLLKLSDDDVTVKDGRTMNLILHCINDFERISDHAVNVMESAKEVHTKNLIFSEKAQKELQIYSEALKDILYMAVHTFQNEHLPTAYEIEPLEEVIDHLSEKLRDKHINRMRKGKCTIEMGFVLTDITTNYERVADHCSNIGICLIEVTQNEYETHGYALNVKEQDIAEFNKKCIHYEQKYALPE